MLRVFCTARSLCKVECLQCCMPICLLPRADACKAVLMRSGDTEESIQDMVAKVFHRWAANCLMRFGAGAVCALFIFSYSWSRRRPPSTMCNPASHPPRSLWFTPRLEAADESGAPLERSAAERAQQLADVALAVYEAGGERPVFAALALLGARVLLHPGCGDERQSHLPA